MSRKPLKQRRKANIQADVTETFINPISGQEESKVGSQFVIDNIDNCINLTRGAEPRYNDGDIIEYMGWDSGSDKKVKGTYNLTKLLNRLGDIVGDHDNVDYNKDEQVIHVMGRFRYKESINIHQPPESIIRVANNAMRLKGNGQTEKQGLYGGY